MPGSAELQNEWQAFLKVVQVREPRLFEHLKTALPKEMTKYNLVLLAHTADDLKEIEVGLKVYHEKIDEFMPLVFGQNRGIKTELSSEEDWAAYAPKVPSVPAEPASNSVGQAPAGAPMGLSMNQNDLLRVLESSIRQRVEDEIRASLQAEGPTPEAQAQMLARLKDDYAQEEENRRMAVRMALIAEGDKILTQLVMAWQQAKQNGDGGPQWNEVKQRLLELLDATVQLMHS
jgi:hypothetical protein